MLSAASGNINPRSPDSTWPPLPGPPPSARCTEPVSWRFSTGAAFTLRPICRGESPKTGVAGPSSCWAGRMALSAWAGVGVPVPLPRGPANHRPEVTGNKVKRGREVPMPDDLVECLEDLVL